MRVHKKDKNLYFPDEKVMTSADTETLGIILRQK